MPRERADVHCPSVAGRIDAVEGIPRRREDRVLAGAGLEQSVLDVHLECMVDVLATELSGD